MSRFIKFLGPAGLVLTIAGFIVYGIMYASGWLAFLPLLAGLIISIFAIIVNYRVSASPGARRTARRGIGTGVSVIVMLAILIFLQTLSYRHRVIIDTTRNKRFSLSPQTVKVLEGLRTDVRFTCFFKETSPEKIELENMLSSYARLSPEIVYTFIDPDQDPVTARSYEVKKFGSIFIESDGKKEEVKGATESVLTNAVARITSGGIKTVYFTTGHGEKNINDPEPSGYRMLRESLESENFVVRETLLPNSGRVPADCTVLVVAGPTDDILKSEQNWILDYITSGGKILLLLDPVTDIPLLEGIAAAFGITVNNDVVVDRAGKALAGNFLTPVVNRYGKHSITSGFRNFSFFPQARSISVGKDLPVGLSVTILCTTDKSAYAEYDIETLLSGSTQYQPASDKVGPLDLAAAAEMVTPLSPGRGGADNIDSSSVSAGEPMKNSSVISRLAVFGDSDFCGNSNLRLSGNRDLLMNTFNWLAEEEDLIAIRPKDSLTQPVVLTSRQGRVVFWLPVVGLPAVVAVIGIIVFVNRRRSG